ncbi:MAG: efflux RND transporter periplasmic adaptor subunit, partial [Photobacterium aquimaris]|nr:efflux RND transporter periplasmic adaptor subunit [Photobacterium aquimaris]
IAAPIMLLNSIFLLSGCSEKTAEIKQVKLVKTFKINDFEAFERRQFTGQVKGVDEVNLTFRVDGPLIEYPVNVGDEVNEGDVIAKVDPHDFKVRVHQFEGQLSTARASQVLAEKEYLRAQKVHQKNTDLISYTELDRRKAAVDTSRGQVKTLEASLQSAQDALSYTELKAPFSGRIVSTYVYNFEYVKPQQPIVKIVSLNELEVIVDVPESLISLINHVRDIKVTFPNLDNLVVSGRISEIGSEASFRTRTYPVTVNVTKPENVDILAGMTVSVSGRVARKNIDKERSFTLPLASVFRQGEQSYVWRITTNSVLEKVAVYNEKLAKTGVMVTGKLNSGDTVVIAGTKFLNQGDRVEVLSPDKLMR